MTFQNSVYAVDGATITGQLYRLNLQAATYDGEGIIRPKDLEVRELSTPGTSIRILNGGGVILGREVANQGSYFGYNVGDEELPIAATGTGETRSDLIVARAEDPTFSGSPWTHDPATDRIIWPRVISNVPPGTTSLQDVNPGESGITLARIDMPESTATVTQDLITDLRFPLILNPYFQDSIQHGSTADQLTSTTFVNWPVEGNSSVQVPTWATRADITVMMVTVAADSTAATPHNVFGDMKFIIGGVDQGFVSRWNTEWPSGRTRLTIGHGQTIGIAGFQGQTVALETHARISGGDGFVEADGFTSIIWGVFFRAEPEFNF